MRVGTMAVASAGLLAITACGGSSMTPGTSPGTTNQTQIAAYQDLSGRVQSAALSYGATMTASTMTVGACAAAHDAYDSQVRPWVSQMVGMGGAMDGFMGAHDGSTYADMSCTANEMLGALDAHRQVACTFTSLTDDQAESTRHVGAMSSYSAHVYDRCGQMMGGLNGYGYMWGPTATGCGGTVGGSPTDPAGLGARIFAWGIGVDGQPIVRTGGSGMMMSGCAGCHGSDGHGRRTMMFTTPNVTYPNLTDPSGMLETDGSRGSTYTDDLIRRAVVTGVGADGAQLATGMPRWQLSDQDWADLLLFLKTLH